MPALPTVRHFRSAAEFRRWLEKNHARRTELWVGFYKKGVDRKGITYREAVDQALCYGWIDGLLRRVDAESYTHRFTPRKQKSTWSNANIKRLGELKKLGLVKPAGLAAFGRRTIDRSGIYAFENPVVALPPAFQKRFRAAKQAWAFFQAQTPSYRKVATAWVMGAKREETRVRRLVILIEDCASGVWIKPMRWQKKTPR
jgi:uncharacterized protein YdeI (YjbR/CyaY-like superfamily)